MKEKAWGFRHLVSGDKDNDVIPQSMQLIAGRTGQEYNQRKNRNGAFWEDRYHATAVESGSHLIQCLVYIDLQVHKEWIEEKLKSADPFREDRWTESLAVGGEGFVKEVRDELGIRAIGRMTVSAGEQQQLRDVQQPYNGHFDLEKDRLSQNIGMEWNYFTEICQRPSVLAGLSSFSDRRITMVQRNGEVT